MIKILVEFGIFTRDTFGNLNTLSWKSRCMNQMIIYCVILQALTVLFLLKTLQCFPRDTLFLRAEPLRRRNEISKIRHPGQTSELLWNLLPLHLITVWQWRSDRWREAGNGNVMPFTSWEFPRYKFQVSGFQNFFFFCSHPKYSNTRVFGTIHEALSKYSVRLFCSETLHKTNVSSETLGKQLPRWQWANTSWKKNIVTQQLNSVMFMPKGTWILSCTIGLRKYTIHTSYEILITI